MDLMRACYKTRIRFYSDIPDTTEVTWYKVPRDRDWLPHGTIFSSYTWDDCGPLRRQIFRGTFKQGEDIMSNRPFYNGALLPNEPYTGHFCGTKEQWEGNLVHARDGVSPVGDDLWPLCCPPAPPSPPPEPTVWLWLKEDGLQPAAGGTTVAFWWDDGPLRQHFFPTGLGPTPVYVADGGTGLPAARLGRAGGASGGLVNTLDGLGLSANCSYFLAMKPNTGVTSSAFVGSAIGEAVVGNWNHLTATRTSTQYRMSGVAKAIGSASVTGWHVWAARRLDNVVTLWRDGVRLGEVSDIVWTAAVSRLIHLVHVGITNNSASDVGEVLVLQGVTSDARVALEIARMQARWF